MKTMVVLDEAIVAYLLHLAERYGDRTWRNHDDAVYQLRVALEVLAKARAAVEDAEK